jgi:hypothetical protein
MKDLRNSYKETARNYIAQNLNWLGLTNLDESELSHITNLAASVMMTRDNYMMGGGFVQAVVENDLEQAISRADGTAIKGLKTFTVIKRNCYINENVEA